MPWLVNRKLLGPLYAVLGAAGVGMLLLGGPWRSEADRYVALFFGSVLTLIGVCGLALVLFIALFPRFPTGPVLTVAPSGAPATLFRRSPFMPVLSVVILLGLGGELAAIALVVYRFGYVVWAALLAVGALVLLRPLVAVVEGRVEVGGLWLTGAGLEYRRDAVGWTLQWSDLRAAQDVTTVSAALPFQAGPGRTAAVRPVLLALTVGGRVAVHRTTRRSWNREVPAPRGGTVVDCFDLAGGHELITETIERYRLFPELREQLGTAASTPRHGG